MTDATALVVELAGAMRYFMHQPGIIKTWDDYATATLPIIAREVEKARAEGFAAGMEFDPDEATGCADDALFGMVE